MIRLVVWIILPSGKITQAGEIVVDDPDSRGFFDGRFRYAGQYLDDPESFSLDPIHLPLTAEGFAAERPHAGVHGVFEDSLPDDWGRRIMVRRHKLGRIEQRVPNLLRLLGNQGIGALMYTENGSPYLPENTVSSRHLQELVVLAEKFDRHGVVEDDELSLLFQAGSSPGGARPKALVEDERNGYLAKFASYKDRVDVVGLEAATMKMARQAGIETAETTLLSFGSHKCLLVKRFDITPTGGRNHLISMKSLLAADGYYYLGYRDMAEIIKHVSGAPKEDLRMLYKQMVFNVMVGNTDDHLKNFNMLHGTTGWRLSPAFDLVPNVGFNREHVLRIGFDYETPDRVTLLKEAKFFGIKRQQAATDMVEEVYRAVSGWPAVFDEFAVPVHDAEIIGKEIDKNISVTR